ncbi:MULTISPECIES: glycosyltransferase family 2 protein [unclassified Paenibacillus]|uniref:glycosyltransferase family 2 protein n=1 Tax=unclassified Paenibacillus TaxID=185978 RepID=UPI000954C142|nr:MULTISPECIES: glycosyltransferase family 2 protein [unclassified Paenibacillus]SIR34073.1 Glycosyl transferase family 2 [Paenibacillus sp. RU4X]SIR44912.1 Glycosyl transferase family 2 [Paenibacillus sp. RU4T]
MKRGQNVPLDGAGMRLLKPGVTFETKCYEEDWRELLQTDRLRRTIERHAFPFAEKVLYINNVSRPELVARHAQRLVDEGVLTSYAVVEACSGEALDFFGLSEDSFAGGYYYSIAELVAIYRCRTEYLLHYSGDSMLGDTLPWISPSLERMRAQPALVCASPVPSGDEEGARQEALTADKDFYIGYGFSDQCYLVRTEDFRARIYGESHPASARYPSYGGELFEKRVDSWMRNNGYMRLVYRHGSYIHQNIRRDVTAEAEGAAEPVLACYRSGMAAMEGLDYESAIVWFRLSLTAASRLWQQGRETERELRWLPHLQLSVCYDRLGRTEEAHASNEAAAAYAPSGHFSIEYNRAYFRSLMLDSAQAEHPPAEEGEAAGGTLLSLLIPSLPERKERLDPLLETLALQTAGKPVELIVMTDNRRRSTGAKRNSLLQQAQGRYVAFIDDDDRVSERYVDALLDAMAGRPEADCIVFEVMVHEGGKPPRTCLYGVEYEHGMDESRYYRKPNHLMVYRRELALRHPFRDIGYGEDDEWAARASRDIVDQARIDEVLYHYDWVVKPLSWYDRR